MARTREFDTEVALERAMEVFRVRGYEATTTRQLEQAMGIGTGSMYAAFGSKEGVYVAALEHSWEQMMAVTRSALSSAADVRQVIRRLLDGACRPTDDYRWPPGCLLLRTAYERAGQDPRVDRMMRDAVRALEHSLQETLRGAKERGGLDAGKSTGFLAHFLVTTIQGLRVMAMVDPDPRALSATVEVAMSCLD